MLPIGYHDESINPCLPLEPETPDACMTDDSRVLRTLGVVDRNIILTHLYVST